MDWRAGPAALVMTLALGVASALAPGACGTSGGQGSAPTTTTAPPAATAPAPATGLAPVGETEVARVVRVVDGDTLIIDRGRGNERLRYIGVDTPETVKPDTPVEFMGTQASAANAALVDGREIVLERDVSDTDRFDRLLRYAWLGDGGTWTFVNLELVRQGFAQVVTYPPDVRWTDALLDAQREARGAGRGLWGVETPAP